MEDFRFFGILPGLLSPVPETDPLPRYVDGPATNNSSAGFEQGLQVASSCCKMTRWA